MQNPIIPKKNGHPPRLQKRFRPQQLEGLVSRPGNWSKGTGGQKDINSIKNTHYYE